MTDSNTVRRMYDEYRLERDYVLEELRAEIEAEADRRLADKIEAIRAAVQEAHRNGESKADLRKAVRAYGNASLWKPWWSGPVSKVGRPPKRVEVNTPEYEVVQYQDPEDDDYLLTEITFHRQPKDFNEAATPVKFPIVVVMEYGSWMPYARTRDSGDAKDWVGANIWSLRSIAKEGK